MANNSLDFMKDVLAAPLGEVISAVGQGVAEAQAALDEGSLAKTLQIYSESDDEGIKLLREIGYRPTFYVIPEVEVTTHISLSIASVSTDAGAGAGAAPTPGSTNTRSKVPKMYATPVNASVANKYNFNSQASTTMKFKIVPVPPAAEVADVRVVPDLVGKNVLQAEVVLRELELTYTITNADDTGAPDPEDTGTTIATQSPEAGSLAQASDTIEVTIV